MVDAVSLVLGSTALLSVTGGLGTLLQKVYRSLRAEHELKTKALLPNRLNEFEGEKVRLSMIELINKTDMKQANKDSLLAGLEQPSKEGRDRYAQKLYKEVQPRDTTSATA